MKKLYFLFSFLIAGITLHAQYWINLTYTNTVTAIQRSGSIWWVGTTGGLIRYDTVNKTVELFNCGNSELPANYVNDLTLDDNQTLWVATKKGLARYEGGKQFSVFSPATGSLYSKNVLFARNERGYGLWIATDSALTLYDGTTWTHFFKDDQGKRLDQITYLYPVQHYGVFFANENQVLFLDHAGKFTDAQFPGNAVRGIAYDANNNLYVAENGYSGGFYELTSQWDHYTSENSPLASDVVLDLRNDHRENIYFLHGNGFSMKTSSDNWSIETGENIVALENKITTAIYPDTLGALGLVGGLMPYTMKESYDGGYSSHFWFGHVVNLNKSDLETNEINDVAFRNGIKYIATRGVAVWNKYNHVLQRYDSGSIILTNPAYAMDVDAFGRIWIADYNSRTGDVPGGFGVIDHGKFTKIKGDSILGFPISGVDAIQWETTGWNPDTTGRLWISYWGKDHEGIAWCDGGVWHTFPDTTGAPWGFYQFVNDRNGVKWFATDGGIYSYDGKKLTRYWDIAPLHRVKCAAIDHDGNLWFGAKPDEHLGWKGGLARYDGKNWLHYTTDNSLLPDNDVTSIAVDTSGTIWVGTRNGGILKIVGQSSVVLNEDNSLLDNNCICRIAVDTATNDVWILNNKAGIFVYNKNGILYTGTQDSQTEWSGVSLFLQNHPNPFSGSTFISYSVPGEWSRTRVILKVYNLLGQEITTLANGYKTPGKYTVKFRAEKLVPGIYIYRLQVGNRVITKKMVHSK